MTARTRKRVAPRGDVTVIGPVDPPADLSPTQAAIWRETVAGETGDFSSAAAQAMLRDYCSHRATADLITGQVQSFDPAWASFPDGIARLDLLARMRDREVRAAAAALVRLRAASSSSAWSTWS